MAEEKQYQPHQQRVVNEKQELDDKTGKLGIFIKGDLFESLPEEDRTLLEAQYSLMRQYCTILGKRIARF